MRFITKIAFAVVLLLSVLATAGDPILDKIVKDWNTISKNEAASSYSFTMTTRMDYMKDKPPSAAKFHVVID
jgi:hypothetical protein